MNFDPAHPLLVACRSLAAAFDARDAIIAIRLNISRTELRLLNLLEDGPRSQVEIASHLGVTRAAVTAMVDRLSASDLVNRQPSLEDRRVNLISLTPTLWRELAEHYGAAGRRVLQFADPMTPQDLHTLTGHLHELAAAIQPQ